MSELRLSPKPLLKCSSKVETQKPTWIYCHFQRRQFLNKAICHKVKRRMLRWEAPGIHECQSRKSEHEASVFTFRFMCHTSRAFDGNFKGAALLNVFYKKSNSTSYQRAWQSSRHSLEMEITEALKWKGTVGHISCSWCHRSESEVTWIWNDFLYEMESKNVAHVQTKILGKRCFPSENKNSFWSVSSLFFFGNVYLWNPIHVFCLFVW